MTPNLTAWFRVCQATKAEVERAMTGDADIPSPTYQSTLAVTVNATPTDIWPWLMQLGRGRGGLYSYDWLDRLFGYLDGPSAERILPQYQHLEPGDVIPMGHGGFPVQTVVPYRTLVLAGKDDGGYWSWELGLYPLDDLKTRLVSRNRASVRKTIRVTLLMWIPGPAAWIMTRKMLVGVKCRAERSAAAAAVA